MLLRLTDRVLRERQWGDECVVFDIYSGETHYLNPLACAIFRRVAASEFVDLDSLCAELARLNDPGGAREVSLEAIGSAAAMLRSVGLILVDDSET